MVESTESMINASGSAARGNPAAPVTPGGATAAPSHGEIAQRAYAIYERGGRRAGECVQNWQQAENELRRRSERSRR